MFKIHTLAIVLGFCLAVGPSSAFALSSVQGPSVTGTNANVADPDDQTPVFLHGPNAVSPFSGSRGYLTGGSTSSTNQQDQSEPNVLGPSVRELQGYPRN